MLSRQQSVLETLFMHVITRNAKDRVHGFTLVELLVVIAIIGILAGLLLPTLSKAKQKGQQTVSLNNLKQLGLAFHLYVEDNDGGFPAGASINELGNQPEDWIWWQNQPGNYIDQPPRDITRSAIVPYVGGFQIALFRCPGDKFLDKRVATPAGLSNRKAYRFSYSLNAYTNEGGMATYINKDRSKIFINRMAAIRNPVKKAMLIEEKGFDWDGPGTGKYICDGRWVPGQDPLTQRHQKRANLCFADGHIATVATVNNLILAADRAAMDPLFEPGLGK